MPPFKAAVRILSVRDGFLIRERLFGNACGRLRRWTVFVRRCGALTFISFGPWNFQFARGFRGGSIEPVLWAVYWGMGPDARLRVPYPRDLPSAPANRLVRAPVLDET